MGQVIFVDLTNLPKARDASEFDKPHWVLSLFRRIEKYVLSSKPQSTTL